MSATPKSLRSPPPRRFENYILTRATSANIGLTRLPDSLFTPAGLAGESFSDDGISEMINIGFDFSFDGVVYKNFVASTNGYIVLVDPTESGFSNSYVLAGANYVNSSIKSTFTGSHVLMAAWFDDLRNVSADVNTIFLNGTFATAAGIQRVREGFQPPPIAVNASQFGVKYYHDSRSEKGRRLIVRWNSLTDYNKASTVIRFEIVIYENGTIEYRYDPRRRMVLSSTTSEDATIGIFMPNGTSRFRDFSLGLGYRDNERQQYRYGGAVVTGSYTDLSDLYTASYTANLRASVHWPGLGSAGSAFIFSPPVNRRKVLARPTQARFDSRNVLPSVARTGDYRVGSAGSSYDDRRAVPYITVTGSTPGVLVNYPSTLQRFFGDSEPTITQRQDLFAGDFQLTGSVVKSVVDQFIIDETPTFIEPFSEHKLYENDPSSGEDEFFVSGSSIELFGDGLQQPLKSKTKIKLSFRIDNNIILSSASCNIYYYNPRSSCWNVPQNSTYVLDVTSSTQQPPITGRGDQVPAHEAPAANQCRVLEDIRGFGPIGNCVASGTHNPSGIGDQTDASIGSTFSAENVSIALSKRYDKSLAVNEVYKPTVDEMFTLPISHPFLIEKAVIEIPMAMGNGWFRDKTTCFQPLENTTGSFDFAGPGLTLSLFNQTSFGTRSRRDLILSGTITHQFDTGDDVVFSNFPSDDSTYQIRPQGFGAFGAAPGAVVTPVSKSIGGYVFTGSVKVKCQAQVANGVILKMSRLMSSSNANLNRSGVIDLFNSPQISLGDYKSTYFEQTTRIAYINNFGRASTGFDPSGGSIFGKEYTTSNVLARVGQVNNPFYLTGAGGRLSFNNLSRVMGDLGLTQMVGAITGGANFHAHAAIPLEGYAPSPYLVNPGNTLVLALSKTRPFRYGTHVYPYTSGGITHDVQLLSGTIEVTLYGSLIKEGREYHDTLNQYLGSDAIHELVIGNSPVLDQYETAYREFYVSGSFDDYVTGSMVTVTNNVNGQVNITTGSRGKVFGKFDARDFGYPSGPSLAFNKQPWSERAGTPRISSHDDITERYWDSVMPSISDALSLDGTDIWIPANDAATRLFLYPGGQFVASRSVGWAIFHYEDSGLQGITNLGWQMGYPFEPRYASAARQTRYSKSFVAKRMFSFDTGIVDINPVRVNGLLIFNHEWTKGSRVNRMSLGEGGDFYVAGDVSGGVTGSMSLDDTARFLYGFGDRNTVSLSDGGQGANHFPEMRVTGSLASDLADNQTFYQFGPIIRGWKYGVYSGLPAFSKAYFRPARYGHMRDMLEQRPYTKYYQSSEKAPSISGFKQGTTVAAVTVKFIDAAGKLTKPENTWSQNLSFEATSSVPYFDGETRNRPDININTLNANIITFKANRFGRVTL